MPAFWLIKSEPDVYPFTQLQQEKRTAWTGIRNFQARNNLRAMKKGDLALYYHTGDEKQVVGIAKVLTAPGEDPTAPGEDWAAVDVAPVKQLKQPVPLATLKATAALKELALLKQSRLSVTPVTPAQYEKILALGKTR